MKRSLKTYFPVFAAMGLLAGAAGCGSHSSNPSKPVTTVRSSTSPSSTPAPGPVDPLTGLKSSHQGPLVAVMVENSEYGRPQYGLASADVVFEAYTEFFYYPRFMLVFWGNAPKMVGPVRSARPYFVSWVHQLGAAYIHAGASNPAYSQIAADGIHNLDLDSNAQNLGFRSNSRPAPHNLFTNVQSDMQTVQKEWGNPAVSSPWPFSTGTSHKTPVDQAVTFTWNTKNSIERWQWDPSAQGWTRYISCPDCSNPGFQQVMGLNSQKPVVAKNVVFQYTQEGYMPDPAKTGWISVQTTGSGSALMLLGSQVVHGTWRSNGPGQLAQYYLPNGQRAKFVKGQTWIEVVPGPGSVSTPFHLTLTASNASSG